MDERPLGITVIAAADAIMGAIAIVLGIISTGLMPFVADIMAIMGQVLPISNGAFPTVATAFGIFFIVGAAGFARMKTWGFFMALLNRLLSVILWITYLKLEMYYFGAFLIPHLVIILYLLRARRFFFLGPDITPVVPDNEPIVPELPITLKMQSEQTVRAKEIREVLSVRRPKPRTCPQCGEENALDAMVCSHCGTVLQASPAKSIALVEKAKAVSSKDMVFCIYCGTKNPADAEYCFRCGKKVWKL